MGKFLSLTVVAQGVETREQAEFLDIRACDELQGYYFNASGVGLVRAVGTGPGHRHYLRLQAAGIEDLS
jgi:EAL domain-containing protein (putative c-di-GMP-specific phosphodiesterase class I)